MLLYRAGMLLSQLSPGSDRTGQQLGQADVARVSLTVLAHCPWSAHPGPFVWVPWQLAMDKCLWDGGADMGVSMVIGATCPGWQCPRAGTPRSGPACIALSLVLSHFLPGGSPVAPSPVFCTGLIGAILTHRGGVFAVSGQTAVCG